MKRFALAGIALTLNAFAFGGEGIFGTKSSPIPSTTSESSMGFFPVAQMLLALLIVLALVKWIMPLAIKKYGKKFSKSSTGGISIEDTASIGSMNLCVVTARGKTFLVGSTPDSVSLLADLSPKSREMPTFHEMLEQSSHGVDERTGPALVETSLSNVSDASAFQDLTSQLERLKRLGL